MRIHPGRSGIKSRRRGSDWASRDNRRASTITRLIATGTPSGDASDARGGRARARTNRFARTLRSSLALVVMCSLESQLMHPTAARSYAGAAPVEQQVPSADKAHHARAQMRTSRARGEGRSRARLATRFRQSSACFAPKRLAQNTSGMLKISVGVGAGGVKVSRFVNAWRRRPPLNRCVASG